MTVRFILKLVRFDLTYFSLKGCVNSICLGTLQLVAVNVSHRGDGEFSLPTASLSFALLLLSWHLMYSVSVV